jgi:hypothetical protein
MCKKKTFYLGLLIGLMVVAFLIFPSGEPSLAHAQEVTPAADHGTCIKCHENLYFLHDTGNWFCIRESPMRCVDCHGGDPSSLKQEEAHVNRKAHPIINEDVSKCQECHPAECNERVELFDQTAGISQVLVAAPYTPAYSTEESDSVRIDIPQSAQEPGSLLMFWEIIPLALIAGLALTIYWIHRTHHNKVNKKEK